MSKIIKNILSLILVISILTLPLTSFATDEVLGAYDKPYQLNTTSTNFTVTVDAESEAWVKVNDCIGSTLKVDWASNADYMIVYCRQPNYPETASGNNTLSFTMVNGADMFSVYNSGAESVEVRMTLIAGSGEIEQGTVENPELLTMTTNMFGGLGASATKDLEASNSGYYYKTVAPADGIIAVSVGAYDADFNSIGWMYFVNNETAYIYGETHWSDDEEPVMYEEVNVSEGDTVVAFASTYDPENKWNNPAGTVSVNFSFTGIGDMGNPEVIEAGEHTAELGNGSNGYYYSWTAPSAGTATVAIADGNTSGWQYSVSHEMVSGDFKYGDTHWNDDDPVVSSEEFDVSAGDVLTVSVNTYDPDNMFSTPAGSVKWTLTFTPGEGGTEPDPTPKPDPDPEDPPADVTYENSDVTIELGTKDYPLLEGYTYTIFPFEPTQTGKYTFTATNALIGIVSYNGMWVSTEPSDETVNSSSFTWECSGVGQTIWVAAKYNPVTRTLDDGKSVNITVKREDLVVDNTPWTIYKNTHKPTAFTFTGNADELEPVEVFDDFVNKPVMGSDGYYHLDSATGPILYVDLDDAMMNLVDAMSYGQVKDIIMDGDKIVAKINYNEAFGEYADAADKTLKLYPLTDDLITIYKGTGHFQNWYGKDGWLGTTADDGYLFACYFINDGSINNNNGNSNNNNNNVLNPNAPSFGDNTLNNGKPVTGGNSFGSTLQNGKPVTGTQIGAAQTSDPFIINLAVLAMSGLGVVITGRRSKKN